MILNSVVAFAVLALLAVSSAGAQTVKIGLIMPYSGQFADAATQMDNAIKLYVKEHGDTVAGRKLEFIRRDTAASRRTSPSATRRSWWCATASISSPDSCSRPTRSPRRTSPPKRRNSWW